MSQITSNINKSWTPEQAHVLGQLAKTLRASGSQVLDIPVWQSWWNDYEISYNKILERISKRIVKLKNQLVSSDQAFIHDNPETFKLKNNINFLESDLLVLNGAKIMIENLYKSYLDDSIRKSEKIQELKKAGIEEHNNYLSSKRNETGFMLLLEDSFKQDKALTDIFLSTVENFHNKQQEQELEINRLKEEIKTLKS